MICSFSYPIDVCLQEIKVKRNANKTCLKSQPGENFQWGRPSWFHFEILPKKLHRSSRCFPILVCIEVFCHMFHVSKKIGKYDSPVNCQQKLVNLEHTQTICLFFWVSIVILCIPTSQTLEIPTLPWLSFSGLNCHQAHHGKGHVSDIDVSCYTTEV